MPLWKLTLSYDGTTFHGWQIQPNLSTVQGTLAAAIRRIAGEETLPQGSGRTDAGVHALGQVASFSLQTPIPPANLQRALNRLLPKSIRVLSAEQVAPPFHARHSAVRKTYEYRIFPAGMSGPGEESPAPPRRQNKSAKICSPMLAPFVWDYGLPLDLTRLNEAAGYVLGRHDFTSFAASSPESNEMVPSAPLHGYPSTPPTPCRTIYTSSWSWSSATTTTSADPFGPDLLIYTVTGSGFLHHMVRNLVGTFIQAGAGRLRPDAVPNILAARARSAAGPTAPALGLFLVSVEYA